MLLTGQALVIGYLVESLSSDDQDVQKSYLYAAGKQLWLHNKLWYAWDPNGNVDSFKELPDLDKYSTDSDFSGDACS